MVCDILEASAHVFSEYGYEKASTNKIAKKAGVSIGSLYQYFPDKDAIISALIEDRWSKIDHLTMETLLSVMERPFAEASEACFRAIVDFLVNERDLMKVLMDRLQYSGETRTLALNQQKTILASKAYLLRYSSELDINDYDAAAYLCVHTVRTYAEQIALRRPPHLSEDQLIRNVVKMLCAYVGAQTDLKSMFR